MLDWLKNCPQNILDATTDKICEKVGKGIAATGIVTEQMALIVILVGIILWMFKNTKVFRWGVIFYFIGFLLEIFGTVLMM